MATSSDRIAIIGAGITGLMTAYALHKRGISCEIFESGGAALDHACSAVAGGMLAPFCELETAENLISELGLASLDSWAAVIADLGPGNFLQQSGTIALAHAQDRPEMTRFLGRLEQAGRADRIRHLDAASLAEMEPALAGRFSSGLYLPDEGQLDPRSLLPALATYLAKQDVVIRYNCQVAPPTDHHLTIDGEDLTFDRVIDCRGLAARDQIPGLRAVKGEVALIRSEEVSLNRMVRLMHPRYPLYIVPRPNHHFLIGATSIECEDYSVTVRSALELLSAAYSLHPAFGEAEIVSLDAHSRPALPHNQPRIRFEDRLMRVNGLYRHGFLLAPALANLVSDYVETGQKSNLYAELYEVIR